MKLQKEKKEALGIIAIALILHAISIKLHQDPTYTNANYISNWTYLIGTTGVIAWVYGFVKYARAKGRSELLAIFLCLFWLLGLAFLLMLEDAKKPKKA
ncbi:MAG: hypothetical protein AB1458_16895 [Bacteroidota bacterium]